MRRHTTNPSTDKEKENLSLREDHRLQDLKHRFAKLGVSVERTQQAMAHTLEDRLQLLEAQTAAFLDDSASQPLRKPLAALKERLEDRSFDHEDHQAGLQKKLSGLTESFRAELDEVRADNRSLVAEFAKQGADRLFSLGMVQAAGRKSFQDGLDGALLRAGDRIDGLREGVEQESRDREECAEALEAKLLAELDALEEQMQLERKIKDETNLKIRQLMEEMQEELSRRIEGEKKERELANNSLLNLLEEACNKIERNFAAGF